MKALYKNYKFKKYNYSKQKDRLRRRLLSNEKKKKKRRLLNSTKKIDKSLNYVLNEQYSDHKKVWAPENFSLIDNTEETISFINKLKDLYSSDKKTFVVLTNVKKIGFDAIIVMLSIMVKFKTKNIGFQGNFPIDLEAKRKLATSGFFESLYRTFVTNEQYELQNDNSINTHAGKCVDSTLSAKIIEKASITVWNEFKRCQGVQRALLELMLNTNNHADPQKKGEKHWWLSVNHNKAGKKVQFSFVDYGVGVFESLSGKKEDSMFYDWKNKLASLFNFTSNAEILELVLKGELHKTVTDKYYRGKGLPGIYEVLKRNMISNLFIITNDVRADVTNEKYLKLGCTFEGTFVSFELEENNINTNGQDSDKN